MNLWGKAFDRTQAIATLCVSLLMILHVMLTTIPKGQREVEVSYLHNLQESWTLYGRYLLLFMILNFSMSAMHVIRRIQISLDMWGVATKVKLNMLSLQQELTVRMMQAGQGRMGAFLSEDDQRVLDQACSSWHDACRIYNNRDFHTWFVSWIFTDASANMMSNICLGMCTLVLGIEVLHGHLNTGDFVMVIASVRSMNGAFSTCLSYYYSLPEGYISLLYLVQVCNMKNTVQGTPEQDTEQGTPDVRLR